MKLSISLPDEDVALVDAYRRKHEIESRSAVVHRALQLLGTSSLSAEYEAAFQEWDGGEDTALWSAAIHDGIG